MITTVNILVFFGKTGLKMQGPAKRFFVKWNDVSAYFVPTDSDLLVVILSIGPRNKNGSVQLLAVA